MERIRRDITPYFGYLMLVATLGPLLFGFHLSELNTPMEVITCKRKTIFTAVSTSLPQCIEMNPIQTGLVSSIFTLGGLVGALASGPFAAVKGRLKAVHISTIFFSVGPVFEALAPNIGVMTVGRFVSGLGAGAAIVCVPIFIAEVAPPAEKGLFGSLTQIMVNVGILIAQLLGYFLSHGQYWRIILAVGGFIGAVQAAGLFLGVESPRWLAEEGKPSKARKILRKIRGEGFDIDEEILSWGTDNTIESDEEETLLAHPDSTSSVSSKVYSQKPRLGFLAVIRDPDSSSAVLAVVMVMIAQQFTGINSIVMYGVGLLADLLGSNSALLNLLVSVVNIIVTVSAAPLVDRLGRKTCLLGSVAGMGTSSLLLAIGILRHVRVLSAIAVILFVASFGFGLGPVPFILASELVGPEAVGATQSWALAASWIATFVVAQFFPVANHALDGKVYFIFTGLAVFFGSFIYWRVPESKGKRNADEVWGRVRRED